MVPDKILWDRRIEYQFLMSRVRVYLAHTWDVPQLYEVNKQCLPIYYNYMEHMAMIWSPSYDVLVAKRDDGIIVGYIIGEYQGRNFHICSIGVMEDYRKHGVGSFILRKLHKRLRGVCDTITLNVHVENHAALRFYIKNGFYIVRRQVDYYTELPDTRSLDAFLMKKTIG